MPVSFLDLSPKPPVQSLTIDTANHGPQEVEFKGVSLRDLAALSERFPAFAKMLDGGIGSVVDDPLAISALIAASLGHCNDRAVEDHVAGFPSADIIRIALAVVRLTFPQSAADPLAEGGGNGSDAGASGRTLPLPSSS
jgi:hypothetical protein